MFTLAYFDSICCDRYVVKTYFMKALIESNGFCKEGRHDSLGCNESGKELLQNNCSLHEQYHFYKLNETEFGCKKHII